jgi:hypothetical protein
MSDARVVGQDEAVVEKVDVIWLLVVLKQLVAHSEALRCHGHRVQACIRPAMGCKTETKRTQRNATRPECAARTNNNTSNITNTANTINTDNATKTNNTNNADNNSTTIQTTPTTTFLPRPSLCRSFCRSPFAGGS